MTAVTKSRARARWGVGAALALSVTTIGLAGPANADPNVNQTVSGTVLGDPGRDGASGGMSNIHVYATDANNHVVNVTGSPYCSDAYPDYYRFYYCSVSTDSDGNYAISLPGSTDYTLHFADDYYWFGGNHPGAYLTTTTDAPVEDADVTEADVTMIQSLDCTTKTTLTGVLAVGQTLTAGPGALNPASADDVTTTYSWSRVGQDPSSNDSSATTTTPIDDTGSTYTLTPADQGSQIVVTATPTSVKRGTDTCETLTSRAVAAEPSVPGATAPTMTGTFHKGELVRAHTTAPDAKVTYQWLSDGRFIPGAKYASYKLTSASVGHRISVRALFHQASYADVTRNSRDRAVTK